MKSRVSNVHCWTVFWCSACPSRTQCVSHFCLALQVRTAFHEAPSTEAKRDLTDQGRELHKGINNLGKRHRELCRFSALFHLSNSIFHRAIKIFPWLHNRWTFSFAAYARSMLMLWFLLTTMRLTSLVSVENTEYLMLSIILPTTVCTTDWVWLQTSNISHRMFYDLKYFLIILCSWKRISKFIICYFPDLFVFK